MSHDWSHPTFVLVSFSLTYQCSWMLFSECHRILPVAELVGLSAGDESLCEVGTGLVSWSSEHKCVKRLNLAEWTAHREVWGSATVNSHGPRFISCVEIANGTKKIRRKMLGGVLHRLWISGQILIPVFIITIWLIPDTNDSAVVVGFVWVFLFLCAKKWNV